MSNLPRRVGCQAEIERERYRREITNCGIYGWPYFRSRLLQKTFTIECLGEVQTKFGTIDFASRAIRFDHAYLQSLSARQFAVLAQCLFAEGDWVAEERLIVFARYSQRQYAPVVLRRNTRLINEILNARGLDLALAPHGARYGSPYRIGARVAPAGRDTGALSEQC